MADEATSKVRRSVSLDIEHAEFVESLVKGHVSETMGELQKDTKRLRKVLNWQATWESIVADLKAPVATKPAKPVANKPDTKGVPPPQK